MKSSFVFLAVLCVLAQASSAEPLVLANGLLMLRFDERNGRLRSLADAQTRQNFAEEKNGGAVWKLNLRTGDHDEFSLEPASARSFHFQFVGASLLQLVWEDFDRPAAPDLRVKVEVTLAAKEALSYWHIAVENLGAFQLQKLIFPQMPNIPRQENERLAAPYWMGQENARPREALNGEDKKSRRLEWGYPGILSLQCAAFYQANGPGLYLSCDDTNAFRKSFAFVGDGKGNASFEMIHLSENSATPAKNFALPYRAVIGTFRGDWFTAAEIYRSWATNQYWAHESRLHKNVNPSWVPQTALWIWNRGRSAGVIEPARALQKELGLPVSILWHWWHGCPYDTGFPEYLPPREGNESFAQALATARKKDINAIVYMNQRLWGMTTKSWIEEGAEKSAVKGADGKVHPEVYNTFTKLPCASMCLHTEFWRNKYAGLAQDAFTLGVSGIYMDQACSSLACYDPTHGHPLGGGTYWMNGFRLLATDIRQRTGTTKRNQFRTPNPQRAIALAGEGVGESWLPYLDLMLSLQVSKERYSAVDGWEPIPFFQAVYHPFAIQYGNYSSLTMPPYDDLWPKEFAPKEPLKLLEQKFSCQFYLEQARAFVWGQQPTIANFLPSHLQERPEEIAYVLRLAKIRNRALKYLLHGTFLRAPELNAPKATLDMSRLSIYTGQQGGLKTFRKDADLVIASAWRAPDGDTALALANISDVPQTVNLNLALLKYEVVFPGQIYRIDEHGRKKLGRYDALRSLVKVVLPPRGACVVELSGK